jgi:hypothetical protein
MNVMVQQASTIFVSNAEISAVRLRSPCAQLSIRQFDFINTNVNYSRVLTKLVWVADPDNFGRRPGVKALRVAQQAKIKAKSLKLVYQGTVRQANFEAQMVGLPKRQWIHCAATVSANKCCKLISQMLPSRGCAHSQNPLVVLFTDAMKRHA